MASILTTKIDTSWHPLANGNPPSWACAWGHDEYGVWIEFCIGKVTQRLRWIPPGRFWMGSSEDEPGRYDGDGPRHLVLISQGYWLFDTPCTQALWEAVMGVNPSRFQTPDRPVEQVSWDDCRDFLRKINETIPGLDLALPTEARWELACRAGEQGAIYTGDLEILGDANAPALDAIAWYGGNSGVDFELGEGHEIGYLSDRQFNLNPCGTHPVGLKQPNKLGLHDMLGNVWEWCLGSRREYGAEEETNPLVDAEEAGAVRVLRGGAWNDGACDCRSACRRWDRPGLRDFDLGFRCARVQA